jgi:deoxyribonuclease-2
LDEDGKEVDHWVILSNRGTYDYFYWDSNGKSKAFSMSPYQTNQVKDGALMRTVNQVYDQAGSIAYAMYSDQPPPDGSASNSYAHAKGVVAADELSGFWLIHSKPHWPNPVSDGPSGLPDVTYAQSYMCLSLDLKTLDSVGDNLMLNYPKIYDVSFPESFASSLPTLSAWANGGKASDLSVSLSNGFKTLDGTHITAFAKGRDWTHELYADLVAEAYKADLEVETWRSGTGGRLSSFCTNSSAGYETSYNVWQVWEVNIVDPNGYLVGSWVGTQDHSKWAVSSTASSASVACIGDINRMCSQEYRGGGTVCVESDSYLYSALSGVVASLEDCDTQDPCSISTSHQCSYCP